MHARSLLQVLCHARGLYWGCTRTRQVTGQHWHERCEKMRTALLPEPSGGETVFSSPPTDADAEASTAVTDRYVPARGSLCGAQPPVAVVLGVGLRVYCLGKQTCEEELPHRDPLSWLRWCVVHESRQDLCHGSPYLINTTRFRNPRLTTLLYKKHAFGTQSIAGEKNHPLTEGGQLPLEQPV